MKMSPMQKYAMRLLIASGQVRLPDRNAWTQLTSETAVEQLRRFGGVQVILRDTALPQRSSSAGESRLPASAETERKNRTDIVDVRPICVA